MCEFISFFHRPDNGDIVVSDLTSHGNTEKTLNLGKGLWREGHFKPNGELILRLSPGEENKYDDRELKNRFLNHWSTFVEFLNWCILATKQTEIYTGSLDVRGCDLKGVALPKSIGGYLDVRGCDLKGVALPKSIGGYLDVRGCDLKGVALPKKIKLIK